MIKMKISQKIIPVFMIGFIFFVSIAWTQVKEPLIGELSAQYKSSQKDILDKAKQISQLQQEKVSLEKQVQLLNEALQSKDMIVKDASYQLNGLQDLLKQKNVAISDLMKQKSQGEQLSVLSSEKQAVEFKLAAIQKEKDSMNQAMEALSIKFNSMKDDLTNKIKIEQQKFILSQEKQGKQEKRFEGIKSELEEIEKLLHYAN